MRHPTKRNATAETKTFAPSTARATPETSPTKQLSQQLLVTQGTASINQLINQLSLLSLRGAWLPRMRVLSLE